MIDRKRSYSATFTILGADGLQCVASPARLSSCPLAHRSLILLPISGIQETDKKH